MKALVTIIAIIIIILALWWVFLYQNTANAPAENMHAASYKDASYQINGQETKLNNGRAETKYGPDMSLTLKTNYFGNEATGDFNGDGLEDIVFLLTQDGGGSGTFFYVVAALNTGNGYKGTNAVFLGDRIAPQTTEYRDGQIIVNYADRNPGEPMTASPSLGVSKYLKIIDGQLVEQMQ